MLTLLARYHPLLSQPKHRMQQQRDVWYSVTAYPS